MWDTKRKRNPSCVRAILHNPFVSVLTRANNKLIYEEITSALHDPPPPMVVTTVGELSGMTGGV